jgi:hypothetical protein
MSESYDLNRLRAAFAQPDDPAHPESCPSLSEIWDGVHGKLPAGRLRDIVDHLAACSPCAEAWRMALALERPDHAGIAQGIDGAPAAAAAADGTAGRPRWRLYGAVATAAAAAFAVALGLHDSRRAAPPTAPMVLAQRGGPAEPQTATRWLTPSEAALPRRGARLRWSGPPGATYDLTVELVDERGAPEPLMIAAPRGLAATEYRLSVTKPHEPAETRVHATLIAHLPDGQSEIVFRDFRLQ